MEDSQKVVVFSLGEEQYGIPIEQVKEVVKMDKIHKLPNMPEFVEGVMNLRGSVHIIYNLRTRFNMQQKQADDSTRIILINSKSIGFIVDEVKEVIQTEKSDVDNIGELSLVMDRAFIEGVVKAGENMIIILDLKSVLADK